MHTGINYISLGLFLLVFQAYFDLEICEHHNTHADIDHIFLIICLRMRANRIKLMSGVGLFAKCGVYIGCRLTQDYCRKWLARDTKRYLPWTFINVGVFFFFFRKISYVYNIRYRMPYTVCRMICLWQGIKMIGLRGRKWLTHQARGNAFYMKNLADFVVAVLSHYGFLYPSDFSFFFPRMFCWSYDLQRMWFKRILYRTEMFFGSFFSLFHNI